MNTQPTALLYNFNDPERLRQIRRYLNRQKVKVRIVTTPEFLHPLGYLFELPGFQPCAQFNLGKNFSEEMMVLNNFSSEQMDDFLAFFRKNQTAFAVSFFRICFRLVIRKNLSFFVILIIILLRYLPVR